MWLDAPDTKQEAGQERQESYFGHGVVCLTISLGHMVRWTFWSAAFMVWPHRGQGPSLAKLLRLPPLVETVFAVIDRLLVLRALERGRLSGGRRDRFAFTRKQRLLRQPPGG